MPVPPSEELREFIEGPLESKLDANRTVRNRQRRKTRIFSLVFLIVFLPVLCAVTTASGIGADDGFWSTYWMTFTMLFGGVFLYGYIWKNYCAEQLPFDYRSEIAAPVVHFIDPRLTHRPDDRLPVSILENTDLLLSTPDRYVCRDWFEATDTSLDFDVAEIEVAGPRRSLFKPGRTYEFRGLVFSAEMPRRFEGHTVVVPIFEEPISEESNWDFQKRLDAHEPVEFDDARLDALFDIRSTAPDCASRYLTEQIADRLRKARRPFVEDRADFPAPREPGFVVVLRDRRLTILRPASAYFDRTDVAHTTDTSHLHQIGRELSAFVDLAEWMASLEFDDR